MQGGFRVGDGVLLASMAVLQARAGCFVCSAQACCNFCTWLVPRTAEEQRPCMGMIQRTPSQWATAVSPRVFCRPQYLRNVYTEVHSQ